LRIGPLVTNSFELNWLLTSVLQF